MEWGGTHLVWGTKFQYWGLWEVLGRVGAGSVRWDSVGRGQELHRSQWVRVGGMHGREDRARGKGGQAWWIAMGLRQAWVHNETLFPRVGEMAWLLQYWPCKH